MANGAYLQAEEGLREREKIIRTIHEQAEQMIEHILDPWAEVEAEEAFMKNPYFAQGQAGLEKLRWDYRSGNLDKA